MVPKATPHRAERLAVDPQHIRVQHHLDGHQGRVEHPVGHEQERQRHGDRREPVAERAIHDGGPEGDDDERDLRIRHELLLENKKPGAVLPPPGFRSFPVC
jgi:hypothetical protein